MADPGETFPAPSPWGRFHVGGLHLRSELPLSGSASPSVAPEPTGPLARRDFELGWDRSESQPIPNEAPAGQIIAALAGATGYRYVAVDDGRRLVLRVPGCCDFLVERDLASAACRPDPEVDERLLGVLASGLLVAFVLTMAGATVLHASAVTFAGKAVVFAGPSGAGKSTLAALACANGAWLLADDLLPLHVAPNHNVECVGGVSHLRMRPHASDIVDLFDHRPATSATVDGRLALLAETAGEDRIEVGAIVLPIASKRASAVALRRLEGAQAAGRILRLTRVAGWRAPSVMRMHLDHSSRIATQVPVIEAVVPWGPPFEARWAADLMAGVVSPGSHSRSGNADGLPG